MIQHIIHRSKGFECEHLSVQLLSCVWIFVSSWTVACQAPLFITNSWSLLRFMSIESVMPSNHLTLCHPLLLLPLVFPSIRVFPNESVFHNRWPKYWSFSISLSKEYPGLISFRIDWFDLLAGQGTLRSSPTPQFMLCPMYESLSRKREGFQDNATPQKREVYCWLESGPLLRVQRSGTGSESTEPKPLSSL